MPTVWSRDFADPVVLAGAALVRPGGPGQVLAVRNGHVEGASAGLCRARGHERRPKVPDPPRRSVH